MIDYVFSSTSDWSWLTFFLYYFISTIVVSLCKMGKGYQMCRKKGVNQLVIVNRKDNVLPFFIAYIILVLLATVRSNMVGSDTFKYVETFLYTDSQNLKNFDWSKLFSFYQTEPVYLLFNIVVRSYTDNYHVFFLCLYSMLAAAYILFIRHFLRKNMNTSFLKLFIVFYVANMSGMRSALATIPLLLSIISLDNGKYKISILFSVMAILCHYTMLYNLFVIASVTLVKKFKSVQSAPIILIAILITSVVSVVGSSSLLGIFAETKYSFYTETASEMTFGGSMVYVIFALFVLSLFKTINNNTNFQILLYICILFLISYPFLYITGAYRIPNYYALPRLIIWCVIITWLCTKYARHKLLISVGSEVIVFAYMLLRFYKSALDGYFEYVI